MGFFVRVCVCHVLVGEGAGPHLVIGRRSFRNVLRERFAAPAGICVLLVSEIEQSWLPIAETTVYELEGRVVGFISMVGNRVGGIFVDPDSQGQGIGRALMDYARMSRPFLELDVFEANGRACRFYEDYGFRLIDSHFNDRAGHPELRMRLD